MRVIAENLAYQMKPKIRRIINRADMRNRLQSKGQSGLGNTAFGAFLIFCQNFSQLEFRQKTFVTLTAGHEPMRGGMSSLVASYGFCHPTFKKMKVQQNQNSNLP